MQSIISHGVEFPDEPKIVDAELRRLLEKEIYEGPEVRGLSRFVTENDKVLEIGAGIGFISTYIMKVLGAKRIMAFEANPDLIPFIRRVHGLNGVSNAKVRNAVLFNDTDDMPDRVPFYITDPLRGSSLIRPDDGVYREVAVPTARLSAVIAEWQPTLIVCDIEGAETSLFEAVEFGSVKRLYAESHRRKVGGLGIRKLFHDMHRHDFFFNARYSADGQVLFHRLPPQHRGQWRDMPGA
ncbi:MAG: FkbM family methyltransferase [Shimia sp.]